MTDRDDTDLDGDWERQLRFVKEGLGLSEDEIEELRREYQSLEELLDEMAEYRDSAEKLVEEEAHKERVEKSSGATMTESEGLSSEQRERIETWGIDVITVDGRKVVPAHQVKAYVEELNSRLRKTNEGIERIHDRLERWAEAVETLSNTDSEDRPETAEGWLESSDRHLSKETWQAVVNLKPDSDEYD